MTLSEREQRQLDEIELGLVHDGRRAPNGREHMSRLSVNAIFLLVGVLVLTIAVVLTFSEADGLTLLIGCGLLATIVCLHRYDVTES